MEHVLSSKDLILVGSFLVFALSVGIISGRKIKTFRDYSKFYHNTNPAILGLSLAMVIFGSGTLVGAISEMYQVGIIYILASVGYIFNSLITAKFIIPKFDSRFSGMITVSDMMRYFYGTRAEKLSAVVAVIFDVGALSSQLIVVGKLLSYFWGIKYEYGLIITGIVMITYSSLGGIRAVTIMDFVKCIMLLIFIPALASISVYKAGGMISILQNVPSDYLSVFQHKDFIKYLTLFFFFSLPIHMLQPIVVQRILLIDNDKVASKSMYIYALIRIALLWVTASMAFSIIVSYPNVDAKDVLYIAILKNVSSGVMGLIVTSILAIIMCKADAHLNSSSIILTKNIIYPQDSENEATVNVVRIMTVIIGLCALFIASLNLSIIKIIVFVEALWGITIGLPLIISLFKIQYSQAQFWTYVIATGPAFLIYYLTNNSYSTPLAGVAVSSIMALAIFLGNKNFKEKKWDVSLYLRSIRENIINLGNYLPSLEGIRKFSEKHVEKIGADYFMFGVFFGMNYTIPVLMWSSDSNHLLISFVLRGVAIVMCFILLIKNFWPNSLQKYFPLYWHFVLSYTLSFIPLTGLILNSWNVLSLIDLVLSILLLILLVDWVIFIITLSIGATASVLFCYFFLDSFYFPTDVSTGYLTIYSFIFAIIIGLIFVRRKEESNDEKIKIATMFGGVVAHEMRTALLAIKNYIRGFRNYFSILTNSYFIAAKKELVPHVITNSQLKLLENSNLSIEKVINKTFVFIDSLLLNIRGPESNEKESKYSALKIIKEALDSYPFLESERNTINVCSAIQDDFEIKGNKEVVVHIFHNLINNALYFVSKNKVPEIIISLKGNGSIRNQIVVEDNGVGIAKEDLEKIFDRFFTKGKNGTGLGLSFCKIGMQSMGGEIECFSKKHQYTKFILNFPQLIRGNNE